LLVAGFLLLVSSSRFQFTSTLLISL